VERLWGGGWGGWGEWVGGGWGGRGEMYEVGGFRWVHTFSLCVSTEYTVLDSSIFPFLRHTFTPSKPTLPAKKNALLSRALPLPALTRNSSNG